MMFPAVFSPSVWSSCSEESVSSRLCSSSSEGRRALRYGIVVGRAAITENTATGLRTKLLSVMSNENECVNRSETLTWEDSDVIFEKALSFSGLGHETC